MQWRIEERKCDVWVSINIIQDFIKFTISEEQKQLVEEVKRFASLSLNDSNYINEFSHREWKEVADFGILGLITDEKYGGLWESYFTVTLVEEALGYTCKNNGFQQCIKGI